MNKLHKRIFDIAYKNKVSHIGSYISSVDIIESIYREKQEDDIFILSCGHAALALYVVMEKYEGINAEYLFNKHGGHPHYSLEDKIYCSTGSLGLGITIACGRALSKKDSKVFVLISDGECAEGSVWESLRFIYDQNISNISVHVNMNGYAAYDMIDKNYLSNRLRSFLPTINIHETNCDAYPFLKGINAHYHIMTDSDYKGLI